MRVLISVIFVFSVVSSSSIFSQAPGNVRAGSPQESNLELLRRKLKDCYAHTYAAAEMTRALVKIHNGIDNLIQTEGLNKKRLAFGILNQTISLSSQAQRAAMDNEEALIKEIHEALQIAQPDDDANHTARLLSAELKNLSAEMSNDPTSSNKLYRDYGTYLSYLTRDPESKFHDEALQIARCCTIDSTLITPTYGSDFLYWDEGIWSDVAELVKRTSK